MEIFNVHLLELVMIAGLALVVFGPERLPEMGRMAGKQVARFLAWQQQSPELQMVNDMRAEFEKEIADLRDELSRTRKQFDVSRPGQALTEQFRQGVNEVKAAVEPLKTPVIRPPLQSPVPAALQANGLGPSHLPASLRPSTAPVQQVVDDAPVTAADAALNPTDAAPTPAATVEPAVSPMPTALDALKTETVTSTDDVAEINTRVLRLATELQQLVLDLQQRGVLQPDWQAAVGHAEEQTTR